jgi:hypothetical protein
MDCNFLYVNIGVKGQEAGIHVAWLREEFHECPPGDDEATVTLYARA